MIIIMIPLWDTRFYFCFHITEYSTNLIIFNVIILQTRRWSRA